MVLMVEKFFYLSREDINLINETMASGGLYYVWISIYSAFRGRHVFNICFPCIYILDINDLIFIEVIAKTKFQNNILK